MGMNPRLTAAQLAPMMREAMRNQQYRETPLGATVARYVRWLRNEYGATPSTVRDYEAVLARMCLLLADRELIEVTTEDLRDVIDSWAERAARTRAKVTSVIRSFWQWCDEQGHIAVDPSHRIRRPRFEKKVARVLPADARPKLMQAARTPRDRVGLHCLLGLGLRRDELRGLRMRDFDVQRGMVRVFGKGQKERLLPMAAPMRAEVGIMLETPLPFAFDDAGRKRNPRGDDHLLYAIRRAPAGRGLEGQYKFQRIADPRQAASAQTIHRWWYSLAADAGLVAGGVTAGLNMHQARHAFAMEMRRVSGIDAASNALGHADLNTTLGIYGHFDGADLTDAFRKHAEWVAEQDA